MPRRGALGVALAATLALAAVAPPAAAEEGVARGHIGMAAEMRRNLGEVGARYGLGYLWGFVAGFQITRPDQRVALGLQWTTLFGRSQMWETLGDDDPTVADGALKYFELAGALRLRYAVADDLPLYLVGSGGVALMRTHVPIPPRDERLYGGAFAALGVESYLGSLMIGFDLRYGLFGEAPRSVAGLLTVGFGRLPPVGAAARRPVGVAGRGRSRGAARAGVPQR